MLHSWAQPDGSQKIEDTGPLTKKRMETMDEEVLGHALRFIEENTAAGKPWFCWFNTTRMHVNTHLKPESKGATGKGIYADGMVEHDGHIGQLLDKLDELGIADDTIVVYTTDNGAEVMSWPDGGTTIFQARRTRRGKAATASRCSSACPGRLNPVRSATASSRWKTSCPRSWARCGEPDIEEKLKEGYEVGDTTYKVHLDGYNFVPFLTEEDEKWPRPDSSTSPMTATWPRCASDDWKVMFLEQRADGFEVWAEPFVQLRAAAHLQPALRPAGEGDSRVLGLSEVALRPRLYAGAGAGNRAEVHEHLCRVPAAPEGGQL